MANFTENFCPNPSFEGDIEGCLVLNGALISQDNFRAFHGSFSCHVECPGLEMGEGCEFPRGLIDIDGDCCVSLFIFGTAGQTLNLEIRINPGNTLFAVLPITLSQGWQRVEIDDIPCLTGQELSMRVRTPQVFNCHFWVDCVQIECHEGPAHDYIDGEQSGSEWFGERHRSRSYRVFEFVGRSGGSMTATGNIVPVIMPGYVAVAHVVKGKLQTRGALIYSNEIPPVAAFDDFGIFELIDNDPAMTYASWNNSGLNSGTGTTYTRPYSTFYAPRDYLVSNGELLWPRADKAAVGFVYSGVTAAAHEDFSMVQLEMLPVQASPPSPSAYDQPRALHTIVKPDRLNFCTNSSFEVSTAGWTALGSAALVQDNTVALGDIIEYDDFQYTAGTYSMKIVVNGTGDGASVSIPDLIFGNVYTASFYIRLGAGIGDVLINCAGDLVQLADIGGTGYGTGESFGGGTYGGISAPSTDLPANVWTRPSITFAANASTVTLQITMVSGLDVVYPTNFWIDAVLIEIGENVGPYFDGSFGTNYMWETGGTPGLTRSYFYDQFAGKSQAVSNALAKHVPMGISYTAPKFGVPYTQ
jgi:hypothetical protein